MDRLQNELKNYATSVQDCDNTIRDCASNLTTAMKTDDIKQSKELKAQLNDASANREIFELKVKVVSQRIQQLRHEAALAICGKNPIVPAGMDPLTFGFILDHIYDGTTAALIGDSKAAEGKKMSNQIKAVLKCNPQLKNYVKK